VVVQVSDAVSGPSQDSVPVKSSWISFASDSTFANCSVTQRIGGAVHVARQPSLQIGARAMKISVMPPALRDAQPDL
jgi:hypothetical protein